MSYHKKYDSDCDSCFSYDKKDCYESSDCDDGYRKKCHRRKKRRCPKCPKPNFETCLAAKLSSDREVQEVCGTCAWGYGNFKVDKWAKCVRYCIVVGDLSGDLESAHIHKAPACENGEPVKHLCFKKCIKKPRHDSYYGDGCCKCIWVACGCWGECDKHEPLTGALLDALMTGLMYVNVHTEKNPSGEARGQIALYGNTYHFDKPCKDYGRDYDDYGHKKGEYGNGFFYYCDDPYGKGSDSECDDH